MIPRSRYYTIHQDLSRAQVKKAANSGNKITTLGGLLPGSIGVSAGLIHKGLVIKAWSIYSYKSCLCLS